MNKTSATFTLVMCACGLMLGHTASRNADSNKTGKEVAEERSPVRSGPDRSGSTPVALAPPLPDTRSAETVESLAAQGASASYADLAVWLVDADAAEIAAYWESGKEAKLDGDKERLIFLNWTRLDPQAAISAVAGTDRAGMAWWAWAANDPKAALASGSGDRLKDVARGIGEFQPKWLMENFDQIPEAVRQDALGGLLTWKENEDPAATLDFLKQQGSPFNATLFRTFCRKDPWAAYDWLQKNKRNGFVSDRALDTLLDAMKSSHPDDLDRLAAMTPSGQVKRKVEDFVFESLLARDPEEALKRAKGMDAPLVAALRLGQVGASVLATDPEKAFGIGADILASGLSDLNPGKKIETGDGNSMSYSADDESPALKFLDSLMAKDPARVMEMAMAGMEGKVTPTFQNFCHNWSTTDLTAYSKWVDTLQDPQARVTAATRVITALSSGGRFEEAAALAARDPAKYQGGLYQLTSDWSQSNPEAVAAWLESTEMDGELKGQLKSFIGINK
ncbi:MAG: hypothetical protein EOP88_04685 [Verrucomicrobiaceae bacterium]|nr:MAG: hypothetical protein EOP88_04685 [Verrucomicrobiaceae bacterium]